MQNLKYNYVYPLTLTPLSSDPEIDFTQKDVKRIIDAAIINYNEATTCSRTCLKELQSVSYSKRQISFLLMSEQELKSPGRALRTLSVQLVKNDYFKKLITKDNKLFTTLYSQLDEVDEHVVVDASRLSNYNLQKCVIDAIEKGENDIIAKNALDEMKQICIKYGLSDTYL